MITLAFWSSVIAGGCYGVKLAIEIRELSVLIRKQKAFAADLRKWAKEKASSN